MSGCNNGPTAQAITLAWYLLVGTSSSTREHCPHHLIRVLGRQERSKQGSEEQRSAGRERRKVCNLEYGQRERKVGNEVGKELGKVEQCASL